MKASQIQWNQRIKDAYRAAAPIVALQTSDPASAIAGVRESLNGDDKVPYLQWDVVSGLAGHNKIGMAVVEELIKAQGGEDFTPGNPVVFLTLITGKYVPQGAVIFMHMAPRHMADHEHGTKVVQALWNLRDKFKTEQRMLVLLGHQFTLPAELENDVLLIDQPLPSQADLGKIVDQIYVDGARASKKFTGKITGEIRENAVAALTGVSPFAADQLAALNIRHTGLDVDELWEAKCKQVENTPGLKVFRGGERFDDIGGYDVLKQFLRDIIHGEDAPEAFVFLDEFEKSMAGASGDMSGTSQDQLATMLGDMQDNDSDGVILVGVAGGGKSAVAKATGNEAGKPTIQLDLGGAKAGIVGASEANIRQALKVIKSVSNGRAFYIATCNSIDNIPPEMRRRFKLGTFFVNLPDKEARDGIWAIYEKKYGVKRDGFDGDEGWTGAEIKNCCMMAKRLRRSVAEAAKFVVPVAKSAPEKLEALQRLAHNRFLDASKPGVYLMPGKDQAAVLPLAGAGRSLKLDD